MSPDKEIGPLIGPRAHERSGKEKNPREVRLDDNSPLWHLFLPKPDAYGVTPDEAHVAKNILNRLIARDRDAVLSCQGKTREEALRILELADEEQPPEATAAAG